MYGFDPWCTLYLLIPYNLPTSTWSRVRYDPERLSSLNIRSFIFKSQSFSASHRTFLNDSFRQSIFFNFTTQDDIWSLKQRKHFFQAKKLVTTRFQWQSGIKESILLTCYRTTTKSHHHFLLDARNVVRVTEELIYKIIQSILLKYKVLDFWLRLFLSVEVIRRLRAHDSIPYYYQVQLTYF